MSILLKTTLKVLPVACLALYSGIITIGCIHMNRKEGLDLNPIDIMLHPGI